MKVTVKDTTDTVDGLPLLTRIDDDYAIAQLLAQDSCAAVTIERENGHTYRYVQVPE